MLPSICWALVPSPSMPLRFAKRCRFAACGMQQLRHLSMLAATAYGMKAQAKSFKWGWKGREGEISYDVLFPNEAVSEDSKDLLPTLFIPAPSFVSTKTEWLPLVKAMAKRDPATRMLPILVDLPGYGSNHQMPLTEEDMNAETFTHFFADLVSHLQKDGGAGSLRIVAGGHTGFFALLAYRDLIPGSLSSLDRLVLASPTWRGPFPTIFRSKQDTGKTVASLIRGAYGTPLVGGAVHGYLSSKGRLTKALSSHVFTTEDALGGGVLEEKQRAATVERPSFVPPAFITGGLDPFGSVDEVTQFLKGLPAALREKTCVLGGADFPSASKEELYRLRDYFAAYKEIPGALLCYEQFADEAAEALSPVLSGALAAAAAAA
ncbi:unnamed protein product [Vitrella brassicaformis CCMP3155]|uniref:AB hydrolase-1 domain-containing protein n=2 Tax=Vitrella brassicaformis TaxID=1169539 RepID=A0A0G4EEW9_VITBC|nr:unnamed protein product [Vitrella brassicaformis CCMP3155]|eukprot:CEL93955.1 unnamed protein product [Vitrella brassicaformis CCMP3155]